MKKKFEWSKLLSAIITAIFGGFSLWSIYEYYSLAQLAIATGASLLPDPTIAVTCITVVIGALLSYFLYQFGLKNSRNKYGIDNEGNPFKQKIEYEEAYEPSNDEEAQG